MNFTSFGMWVAHGEGKLVFDNENEKNKFIPLLKYTDSFLNIDDSDDDDLNNYLSYPKSDGSTDNTAGVISIDGRILGLMLHFERSFLIDSVNMYLRIFVS